MVLYKVPEYIHKGTHSKTKELTWAFLMASCSSATASWAAWLSTLGRSSIRWTRAEVEAFADLSAGRAGPRATGAAPGGGPYRWGAALWTGHLSPGPPRTPRSAATSSRTAAPAAPHRRRHQPLRGTIRSRAVESWTKPTALKTIFNNQVSQTY